MKTLLTIVATCLALSGGLQAKEQLLLKASNDLDADRDQLLLKLDENNRPTHLIHREMGKKDTLYRPSELAKGVVLRRQSGKELLVLTTRDFNPQKGAKVELRYLYSGLPPAEFKTVNFAMKKQAGQWAVFSNRSKKPVKAIRFLANRKTVFGYSKAIGIKTVKLSN